MKSAQQNLSFDRGEDILDLPTLTQGGTMSLEDISQATGRDARGDVFSLIYFNRLMPIPGVGHYPATYSLPEFYHQNTRGRLR